MLVTVGGRERSREEWEALFASAGMRIVRVVTPERFWLTAGAPAVIEVKLR